MIEWINIYFFALFPRRWHQRPKALSFPLVHVCFVEEFLQICPQPRAVASSDSLWNSQDETATSWWFVVDKACELANPANVRVPVKHPAND